MKNTYIKTESSRQSLFNSKCIKIMDVHKIHVYKLEIVL